MKKIHSAIIILSLLTLALPVFTYSAQIKKNGTTDTNNEVRITNPIGKDDPAIIIGDVVKAILSISGLIALVAFVFGGITWMTSGGNPEKVKRGRDMLVWAVIGLIIIFSSYTILRYVFEALQ